MYDAFVSHAGEDKANLAKRLKDSLENNQWKALLYEDSTRVGEEITLAVYEAIHESRVGIFVLTENFVGKNGQCAS